MHLAASGALVESHALAGPREVGKLTGRERYRARVNQRFLYHVRLQ